MLKRSLNLAVDRLIQDVGTKVLGKRKFENDDSVAVDGRVKLSYNIFNMLRQDRSFDA